jgi:5-methylthioadenosine/S-adenosylhomocysteine deaminase
VNDLTIVNGLVIPMTQKGLVLEMGYVAIKDGAISSIGAGVPPPVDESCRTIDAQGRVVMPGLTNAHTHLYQVLFRAVWEGMPLLAWLKNVYGAAEVLQASHFYAGTLLGCVEALKGGVTTVCEHNFLNPHPDCARESIRAIRESGIRAVFARTIMDDGEIVPRCVREKPADAFKTIERLIAEEKRTSSQSNDTRLSFMTGPNTPPINSSPALLKEVRGFVDDNAIGISAHVAESHAVLEAVRRECASDGVVEYLQKFNIPGPNTVFAHCVHLTKKDVDILASTGTSVSHNPVSNMMLGDGVAPVVEMLAAKVSLALGTDGAASNHSQDMFETMKVASLLQKVHHCNSSVIDAWTVMRMATIGGAKALGLERVCGTLEVGKRADLILVDMEAAHIQPINDVFSQMVHCAKSSDVRTVIVDGVVRMHERELVSLDASKIIYDARQARQDIMKRITNHSR